MNPTVLLSELMESVDDVCRSSDALRTLRDLQHQLDHLVERHRRERTELCSPSAADSIRN